MLEHEVDQDYKKHNLHQLPKYAQSAIQQLERSVKSLAARVAELQSTEPTDTKTRSGSSLTWYSLPSGQEYEFEMGKSSEGGRSPIQVVRRQEWDGLWLAINTKHGGLEIHPRSSNLIYVRGDESQL